MRTITRALCGLAVLALLSAAAVAAYRHLVLIPQARATLVRDLPDPDSALFRNERFAGTLLPFVDRVYCAEVNAKNATGGYAGYQQAWLILGRPSIQGRDEPHTDYCDVMADAGSWWERW